SRILNRELSFNAATDVLVEAAKEISKVKNKKISAKQFDNIIWKYEMQNSPKLAFPIDTIKPIYKTESTKKAIVNADINKNVRGLISAIDKMKGIVFTEAFDDIDYPIGSVLHLSVGKDKVPLTYQNMGATIIDSILQAGVNYKSVVKPRVEKFRDEYPHCKTTKDFLEIISQTSVAR